MHVAGDRKRPEESSRVKFMFTALTVVIVRYGQGWAAEKSGLEAKGYSSVVIPKNKCLCVFSLQVVCAFLFSSSSSLTAVSKPKSKTYHFS